MQAITGFLEELHQYAGSSIVSSTEALAVASDLRAFLKEVSESDLGTSDFWSAVQICSTIAQFLTPSVCFSSYR